MSIRSSIFKSLTIAQIDVEIEAVNTQYREELRLLKAMRRVQVIRNDRLQRSLFEGQADGQSQEADAIDENLRELALSP